MRAAVCPSHNEPQRPLVRRTLLDAGDFFRVKHTERLPPKRRYDVERAMRPFTDEHAGRGG